ncbi:Folylpolyglutamate synthase [Podosphaera aphanis]|nr:Folylpolyglutamate synthase [Podosphaera aphanis]
MMAKWNATKGRTYDDAIRLLNTLQTPYKELHARRQAGIKPNSSDNKKLIDCIRHLGYAVSDLNRLNIVHVTGTKGKGSTCAYVDSILRQYRLSSGVPRSVGLFTSPHLISVRERIKINSVSITADSFTKYFFQVWDRFETPVTENGVSRVLERPGYFRYLTLLSYHVFLQERIQAAIYEVGIGGEYDATNVVPSPTATGIATIGIDHTFLLGNTIAEIAFHKAGIMKKNCPNFTVPQEPDAMRILNQRAYVRDVLCSQVVYTLPQLQEVRIQPNFEFQRRNASLAAYLADAVLLKLVPHYPYGPLDQDPLPTEFVNGLEQITLRGRCERIEEPKLIWYLDGAHNNDSIKVAIAWFADELTRVDTQHHLTDPPRSERALRILIFNQQGLREVMGLLEDLFKESQTNQVQFDHVIFCPTVPDDEETRKDSVNHTTDKAAIVELTQQKAFAARWKTLDEDRAKVHVFRSLEESVEFTQRLSRDQTEKPHVFVTGSMHLVGRALGIIQDVDSL